MSAHRARSVFRLDQEKQTDASPPIAGDDEEIFEFGPPLWPTDDRRETDDLVPNLRDECELQMLKRKGARAGKRLKLLDVVAPGQRRAQLQAAEFLDIPQFGLPYSRLHRRKLRRSSLAAKISSLPRRPLARSASLPRREAQSRRQQSRCSP